MTNQSTRASIIKNGVTRDGMVELAVTHSFGDPDIARRLWMFLADCLAQTINRCDPRLDLEAAGFIVRAMRLRAEGEITDQSIMRKLGVVLDDLATIGHPTRQYITALAVHMGMWNFFKDSSSAYNFIAILQRCITVVDRAEAMKGIAEVDPRRSYGDIALAENMWQEVRLMAWLRDDEPEPIPVR